MTALEAGVVAASVALILGGAWALARFWTGRRLGRLTYVDGPSEGGGFVSERYRLVGRPDEVRRRRDGRPVPVEWKRRAAPAHAVPWSHQVQVWAYCLLLEDATGFPPPFGILRYSDGTEYRLPWDEEARAHLARIRRALERPYDGRADPAPWKCAGCRYGPVCDARAPAPDRSTRWAR